MNTDMRPQILDFIEEKGPVGPTQIALHVVANKLKYHGANFICGFAVTGSLKGFEVIQEV